MKAAIYCRLSKEDRVTDGESESIQNQKAMLIQYAMDRGLEIYQIYSDEDYSGADRTRPAFNAMLRDAAAHRFDVVLAKTQSRFTRDMELVERYLHGKFPEWGIRFIAVLDHADTDDRYNKKARQINGLVNEWYLEDLSENVRAVLRHKQVTGQFIGSFAPYGYAKDPCDHNHLVVDPQAAPVVQRIFRMALQGYGDAGIACALNREGLPSPALYKRLQGQMAYLPSSSAAAQGLWSAASVRMILGRQAYIGNLVQGVHRKVSYKSAKIRAVPKSQWVTVPGTHEPLIDRADFELVQLMRQTGRPAPRRSPAGPLAGLVRCACCGGLMCVNGRAAAGRAGYRDFRCALHKRAPHRCAANSVSAAALQTMVLQKMQARAGVRTLTRELAYLMVEAIRVWPGQKGLPRRVEILWRF